jgi:hypothetical protein
MAPAMKDLFVLKVWLPHMITVASVVFALGYYKASLESTITSHDKELMIQKSKIDKLDGVLSIQGRSGSEFAQRSYQVMMIQIDGINRRIEATERRAEATESLIQALRSDLAVVRSDVNWIRRAIENNTKQPSE